MNNIFENLHVRVFNVGHGDHIAIRFPDKEKNAQLGIIDSHYVVSHEQKEPPVIDWINELLSTSSINGIIIKFICISHFDKDHIRGLKDLLDEISSRDDIQLENIYFSSLQQFTQISIELLSKISEKLKYDPNKKSFYNSSRWKLEENLGSLSEYIDTHKIGRLLFEPRYIDNSIRDTKIANVVSISRHEISANKKLQDVLFYYILDKDEFESRLESGQLKFDKNFMSNALHIKFGQRHLLFGGDVPISVWKESIDSIKEKNLFDDEHWNTNCVFFKASHHGSRHSSAKWFWPKVLENGSAVSFSAGSKYKIFRESNSVEVKHPHKMTLEDIRETVTTEQITNVITESTNMCQQCVQHLSDKNLRTAYSPSIEDFGELDSEDQECLRNDSDMDSLNIDNHNLGLLSIDMLVTPKGKIEKTYSFSNKCPTYENCLFSCHDCKPHHPKCDVN